MSSPRPMEAPAPPPRPTLHGAPRLAPSAAAPWTWETVVGAMVTPGASEEHGPGGATLSMGGCWGQRAGGRGAVRRGWKRVWYDGRGVARGGGQRAAGPWPGWVSTAGSPSRVYPRYLRPPRAWQDRGPFPWFWLEGTGPSDRCSQPSRQGLQPPRGSLVCLYNKMIGDTSVLISGLVLLGSLRGAGGGAWTGQGQGWGCQPRGGGPSSLGCPWPPHPSGAFQPG